VKMDTFIEPQPLVDICEKLKLFRVQVKGVGDAKHAQVTRGGAKLAEFNAATLESKRMPGLYACGECLDVDGPCGGYNLHWAWASGIVAGKGAAG
jgi:predicted flavoprotein YhiN